MVGVTEVDFGLGKPLFVNVNEESYSVTTVDHINSVVDVDDYESITVDYCLWESLDSDHPWYDVLADCYHWYYINDVRRFGKESTGEGIPQLMLAYKVTLDESSDIANLNVISELLQRVLATDAEEVRQYKLAGDYIKCKLEQAHVVKDLITAINKFKFGYMDFTALWSLYDDIVCFGAFDDIEDYPFNKSFDEINIEKWCDNMLERLSVLQA